MSAHTLSEFGGLKCLQHKGLLQYSKILFHGSFARVGGISSKPYNSLNTQTSSGDSEVNVLENRSRVCNVVGVGIENTIIMDVCHGDRVAVVPDAGDIDMNDLRNADALITRRSNTCLMLSTADCNPIFLFDPISKQIGLAHAGWRGVAANLASKLVSAMCANGCDDPSRLVAAVGPSIGPCCYRIHQPAQLQIPEWAPYLETSADDITAIDLWSPVKDQLLASGLLPTSIEIPKLCTSCNTHLFFSYWAEKPTTGRFASVICLFD